MNGLVKGRDYQNGLKSKTQLYYHLYEPTLNINTQRGWKLKIGKIYHAKINQKKAGVTVLVSDEIDSRPEQITLQVIMIMRPIYPQSLTALNICVPNKIASKYVK